MTLVIDAAPLVSLADANDPACERIREILRAESGDLVLPAPVAIEADYMIGARLGSRARSAYLADLAAGRFRVESPDLDELATIKRLQDRYADLDPGLADLSVVALAHRFHTRRVLSFDLRNFRAISPLSGGSFVLLPVDLD